MCSGSGLEAWVFKEIEEEVLVKKWSEALVKLRERELEYALIKERDEVIYEQFEFKRDT